MLSGVTMDNSDYFRILINRLEKEKAEQEEARTQQLENYFKMWRATIGKQIEEAYAKNVRSIRVARDVPEIIIDELSQQGFICEPKYTESQMTNSDTLSYYQVTFPKQQQK